MNYAEALDLLENGKAEKSKEFLRKNNYMLEYGYALLMLGKTDEAEEVFSGLDSHRADWIKKIISITKDKLNGYPTYFQIRSFLEIDISMLLKSKQVDFVQKLINYAQFFQGINNESFKFFARALLKNGLTIGCKHFMDKALDEFYNDTELHFLYVEYYLYLEDYDNAVKSLKKCLSINPEYYPALKMKKELNL
ncbi:MAG: hypothetical protein K6E29_00050 [Cyanobacteria bacterium RUI128]|nr:hypothetical protein [Cyanobacteria bacterium RUI128]